MFNTRRIAVDEEFSMRHLIGIVAVCFGLQAIANAQVAGTASELADDRLAEALWQIAAETQTRIGFESVNFVKLFGLRRSEFSVTSRDEALDAAVPVNSPYEWRAIGDVVVVRPKRAWNDASNPFNRPVRNLRVAHASPGDVLVGVRDFILTNRFAVRTGQGIPISFDVQSGTVVDTLNQLMESSDCVLWIASYRPNPKPEQRDQGWDLQMLLMKATHWESLTAGPLPRTAK
jgi:hypothetical protein